MKKAIELYHLSNGTIDLSIANYGCTIVAINAPDRHGNKTNIVTGFEDTDRYFEDHPYFGSTVGRFANRIAAGKFTLDGKEYILAQNAGCNHLHGGIEGFNRKFWQKQIDEKEGITLSYTSTDGEEGYPGNLQVTINFSLSPDNQLSIKYQATTDAPTIINLTNHSYFNLSGFTEPNIRNHVLQVYADHYTATDKNHIPTGEIKPVDQTAFDFRLPKTVGADIDQLIDNGGYDNNFVLNNDGNAVELAAELYEPLSGRVLKVFTNQPGLQVYTSNSWDGSVTGAQGLPYQQHGAIALETQAFPDGPNQPGFPDTILRPGQTFNSETIYQFLTR